MSQTFQTRTEETTQNQADAALELRAKLDYHDTAIKALGSTLEMVTEKNNEMHEEIVDSHKKSMGDLRQEVCSQVMVVKEISKGVQEEFNDKLEQLTSILNDEKTRNWIEKSV